MAGLMARRYDPSQAVAPSALDTTPGDAMRTTAALADTVRGVAARRQIAVQTTRGQAEGLRAALADHSARKRGVRAITAYGRAYNASAAEADRARRQIDIEASYERFERESDGDPAAFAALSDGYSKGLMGEVEGDIAPDVSLILQAKHADAMGRVEARQQSRIREENRTAILDGNDSAVRDAGRTLAAGGSDEQLAAYHRQIVDALESGQREGLFSPGEVRELRNKYAEALSSSVSRAQVDHAAAGVMGAYEASVEAGDAALAGLKDLDDATRLEVRGEVNKRLNLLQSDRKRIYADDLAALNQDIADGSVPDDAEQQAKRLYDRAAMEVGTYVSTVEQIARARAAEATRNATVNLAATAYSLSLPLDPKDNDVQKAVNAFFADRVAGVPRGTPEYQNTALDVARRTRVVPYDAVSWARSMMASDDPVAGAAGAELLRKLEIASPSGFGYEVDDKARVMAHGISSAVMAGAPPEVAVVEQQRIAALPDSHREMLGRAYSASNNEIAKANPGALQGFLNGDARFDRSWLGGAPTAPVAMQGEYNAAVERYFTLTDGDTSQARELAWRSLQRKWGYSEVNGRPEIMPYAPESMFPGLTADVVRADLGASIAGATVYRRNDATGQLEASPPTDTVLVPNEATATTGGAVWSVGVRDEFGALDLLLDDTGRPLRYQLPIENEAYTKAQQRLNDARNAEALGGAAKDREMLRVIEQMRQRDRENPQEGRP